MKRDQDVEVLSGQLVAQNMMIQILLGQSVAKNADSGAELRASLAAGLGDAIGAGACVDARLSRMPPQRLKLRALGLSESAPRRSKENRRSAQPPINAAGTGSASTNTASAC